MNIIVSRTDLGFKVYLRGKLDHDGADQLHRKLALENLGQAQLVVFDFSQLNYISSHGIGTLTAIHRRLAQYGGKVRIENASSDIKKIFSLMQLKTIFSLT